MVAFLNALGCFGNWYSAVISGPEAVMLMTLQGTVQELKNNPEYGTIEEVEKGA